MDDADTMNVFASNAFLKTLEEPPEESLIILITSKPDNLPDTIRSRCSRINFAPLSDENCLKVLQTVSGWDERTSGELSTLIRLSLGRPGLAVSGDMLEDRSWFKKLLTALLSSKKEGWTSKEEMEKWFDLLLIFLRDMAVMKITGDESDIINADIKDFLNKSGKSMDITDIIDIYFEISSLRRYCSFNLNKSLTWNYTGSLLRKTMDTAYA